MKIIYEPRVYVVSRLQHVHAGLNAMGQFMQDHGLTWASDAENDGDKLPEIAGRLCYMSYDKPRPGGNEAYLHHIKEVGHGSVLEHSVWGLIFTDISRSLTHELVRHRAGVGYSQLSQRYVDESVAEYVCPDALKEEVEAAEGMAAWCLGYMETSHCNATEAEQQYYHHHAEADANKIEVGQRWINSVRFAHENYIALVIHLEGKIRREGYQRFLTHPTNSGVGYDEWMTSRPKGYSTEVRKAARQAARSVLPNATETKIMVTANARSWRHMIEMRASRHADTEIRKLFVKVWEVLKDEAPHLFGDYRKVPLPDGSFEITTDYKKV